MSARFDEEWMPFFGNWFWNSRRVAKLGDSAALLYQWLLWYQWENEHLDEPAVMRQIAPGRFARQWSKLWPKVEHLFSVGEDGRLRNPTCAEQREHAEAIRKRGRERASRGAQATNARRWGDRSSDKQAIAQATPERPSSDRLDVACESLGDRTGPDRTVQDRTGETHPIPPGGRDDVLRILAALDPGDTAADLHDRAEMALHAGGFRVEREAEVRDRGDGRRGRVDLRVVEPSCWIEIDRATAREKSLRKISTQDGLRVVVLREAKRGVERNVLGIDAVIGLGGGGSKKRHGGFDPTTAPLQAEIDTPGVRRELAAWVARRAECGHPPLGPVGLLRVTAQIAPRGAAYAERALAIAADRGWRGLRADWVDREDAESDGLRPAGRAPSRAPHGSNVFADELARRNGSNSPTIDVPGVRVGGAA